MTDSTAGRPEPVTARQFDADADLPDWRVLLGRIEATFVARSFAAAAEFVARLAAAADAANHHPDVDLRYPGRVHVALMTHAIDGLTTADVDLARTISSLAATTGLTTEPVGTRLEIAIDAMDIDTVRPFWRAALAYDPWPVNDAHPWVLVDPRRIGPAVWFQQMDAPRPQRNRIHIDVTVPHDEAEARIAAALAAGGRMVSDRRARAFWILADPEGNEACICTWQDRD
jgi:4a-hydroxytetrahydrobiopterin dehydratase